MSIKELIKELQDMYGKEMGSGYFKGIVEKPDDLTIDICEVLKSLEQYEISKLMIYNHEKEIEEYVSVEEYVELYEDDLIEDGSDNSYNWSSPISNHFNFTVYKDDCLGVIVEFRVHYGISDVRCGYSENIWLKFKNLEQFYETLSENNKYISITFEDSEQSYEIEVNIFNDSCSVVDSDGNELEWEDRDSVINKAIEDKLIEATY